VVAGVREWVVRTTARLARQVQPPGLTPAERRAALIGLVVVAGGAATAKSVLIAGDRWSVGAQVGLVASVIAVTGVTVAAGVESGDGRTVAVLSDLGLVPFAREPDEHRAAFVVGPLLLSGVVTAAGLLLRSEPGHLDGGGMMDLVLLVAGAEELIYRGAVLALAHRALPPGAAEVVTALAFGASHLGNDGGWDRVAGPVLGGLAFSWLRHRSGSLAGPIAGHIATNLPGRVWGV